MITDSVINCIEEIVEEAERMRGAYFFSPPCNANRRRTYEARHTHDTVCWEEGGHSYTASYTVKCSCRNVYARGHYTRDGKVTNLTAIKNSLRRLGDSQTPFA